jgi:hypothetical protein
MSQGRIGVVALVLIALVSLLPLVTPAGSAPDNQLEVYSW